MIFFHSSVIHTLVKKIAESLQLVLTLLYLDALKKVLIQNNLSDMGYVFIYYRARTFFGISLSLIIINMAAIMERADENLLPAVYKEVSEAFTVGPSDLGYLTFIRNFVQGMASPVAGILAISYDRPTILTIGILCWALSTAAVGVSKYFFQVAFWRAINGFGLAIVIPALQSFIADSYLDGVRGTGFGFLNLVGTVGGIGGGAIATVMAGHDLWGIPGWRCAFMIMGALSCLIAFLVYQFVVDPKRIASAHDSSKSSDRYICIQELLS